MFLAGFQIALSDLGQEPEVARIVRLSNGRMELVLNMIAYQFILAGHRGTSGLKFVNFDARLRTRLHGRRFRSLWGLTVILIGILWILSAVQC